MSGRRTLTTTRRPPCRTAAWVWPIDAAASGSSEKLSNDLADRGAQLVLDARANLVQRNDFDVGLQVGQFGDQRCRQQVRPGRCDLPELDEHPPAVLQEPPDAKAALRTGQSGLGGQAWTGETMLAGDPGDLPESTADGEEATEPGPQPGAPAGPARSEDRLQRDAHHHRRQQREPEGHEDDVVGSRVVVALQDARGHHQSGQAAEQSGSGSTEKTAPDAEDPTGDEADAEHEDDGADAFPKGQIKFQGHCASVITAIADVQ